MLDLDPQDTFFTILPRADFLFSLLGQKQVCDTGDEAVMKIHKINIGIPEMGTFCAITSNQSIVNLSLKFWGYYEKNMGFHLAQKKKLLPVAPLG